MEYDIVCEIESLSKKRGDYNLLHLVFARTTLLGLVDDMTVNHKKHLFSQIYHTLHTNTICLNIFV